MVLSGMFGSIASLSRKAAAGDDPAGVGLLESVDSGKA